ncbi:hypothetical protein EJ02DRAFT_434306 [Clathrospora elynae]|uniref:Uncharacterized protein n=1 Tax=Clathrospora elynae TaxID=706981 RepID=A0A6A5SN91_9PLEO|nr:hypothetical protein EJ02DRAFT_434306 [Clathrospora elynae]
MATPQTMREPRTMAQSSTGDGGSPWFSYTIEEVNGKAQLVQQQATGERPVIEVLDGGMTGGITIKFEDEVGQEMIGPVKKASKSSVELPTTTDHSTTIDICNEIFATFYNMAPVISTNNVTAAFNHCEQLIDTANTLDCLETLPHLISHTNTTLLQYRQKLFTAIRHNPARWLLLAMSLQNDSIYTEALIHMCGAYPKWPWDTKHSVLPEEMRRLISPKSRELDNMCAEAERNLILLTILVHNGPVQPQENSQFDMRFAYSCNFS